MRPKAMESVERITQVGGINDTRRIEIKIVLKKMQNRRKPGAEPRFVAALSAFRADVHNPVSRLPRV